MLWWCFAISMLLPIRTSSFFNLEEPIGRRQYVARQINAGPVFISCVSPFWWHFLTGLSVFRCRWMCWGCRVIPNGFFAVSVSPFGCSGFLGSWDPSSYRSLHAIPSSFPLSRSSLHLLSIPVLGRLNPGFAFFFHFP